MGLAKKCKTSFRNRKESKFVKPKKRLGPYRWHQVGFGKEIKQNKTKQIFFASYRTVNLQNPLRGCNLTGGIRLGLAEEHEAAE